jgi:type IV secretory pathway protease TraF
MSGRRVILVVAAAGLILGLAPAVFRSPPLVIWNATASAPEGLYRLRRGAQGRAVDQANRGA